jgi:Protein of unknown function (DUF3168)
MIEGQQVAAFVYDRLVADAQIATMLGGRVYRDLVPSAAPLPAATVTLVSSTDVNTLGADRAFGAVLVDVRVIGDGSSYGPINPIADRVDAVLQNVSGVRQAVNVVELRREQVQAFIENESGKLYTHIVATYRTEAYTS